MFEEVGEKGFVEREEEILQKWKREGTFEASVEARKGGPYFSFYDGPPFATGLPHYGHLIAGTIKDVVPRYKTMKGYFAPRRFGWDCHGLPVENEIEKAYELSGKASIEQYGIARFNEECRKIVLRYTEEWKKTVERMGRWVDFSKTYKTMDLSFMESVWWVFKALCEKGLVYEGYKVMPYSAKLGTPLSNFEAGDNYKDVDDPALTVAFELEGEEASLLAWTTTPWTLISNLALLVGPAISYVKVLDKSSGKKYILAESKLTEFFTEYEILGKYYGRDLAGKKYKPLFDYFAKENAFKVILEDSVSVEEGTGIVHAAPAFGEVDFFACKKEGIEIVCPVGHNGEFTKEIPEYEGLFVKDADKDIAKRLKASGKLFRQATVRHRYPFCWRSDTPLIYKAVSTWFVAVEKIKEKLLEANNAITWVPEHIKTGRFGKWLEGARDWAISRNRYWGTPIPIWRAQDGSMKVFGSIRELEEATGAKVKDLHRHFIDDLIFTEEGKSYKRIAEVFDCWFESGSMPYAQNHYPFENQEVMKEIFPADFIAEGADQTRGWFYTLTVIAAALFEGPAFKNVIVNGIVLAENGQKMSKRLKNYPEPEVVIEKYGADAIRLYLLNSPAVYADDLRFSERGVETVLRQVLLPLWNAYTFLVTYARIYQWQPKGPLNPEAEIDRWILSKLQELIFDVEKGMDGYELHRAVEPFVGFIDALTNWYIRRSRERFWQDEDSQDRRDAFLTLYTVLLTLSKVAAPFIPFTAEMIFGNLKESSMPPSVHLCNFPDYRNEWRNEPLEEVMEEAKTVVSLAHALRKEHKLKVRQPLSRLYIATKKSLEGQKDLIAEEVNVKEVVFLEKEEEFVTMVAKPNFRILGKKVGARMKEVGALIAALTRAQLMQFLEKKELEVQGFLLTEEDLVIEHVVKEGMVAQHEKGMTVALDVALTEELVLEGIARELKNKINTMRKEAGLAVTDRIRLTIEATPLIKKSFEQFGSSIKHDTLVVEVLFETNQGQQWDINGELTHILLRQHFPL